MSLASVQLTAVDHHLRKENWLLNEGLITELTDHYVFGVEDRLAQGITSDVAIREIHIGFGGRTGLLKMKEEYQAQKSKLVDASIWREIRLFFVNPRFSFT